MGRKICVEKTVHGCPSAGLAMAGNGVVGPTTKFSGDSKAGKDKGTGSDYWKPVGKDVGMSKHKTAGDSRKTAGGVGAFKAKGTK